MKKENRQEKNPRQKSGSTYRPTYEDGSHPKASVHNSPQDDPRPSGRYRYSGTNDGGSPVSGGAKGRKKGPDGLPKGLKSSMGIFSAGGDKVVWEDIWEDVDDDGEDDVQME